jgi:hypothetical protein
LHLLLSKLVVLLLLLCLGSYCPSCAAQTRHLMNVIHPETKPEQ